MVLRALPADYASGDTPTADEMNGLKDHAGNSLARYTTVLRRATLVQAMPYNTINSTAAIQWQSVVGGYNGLGWAVGTPSRIPCPSGAGGRYQVTFTGIFAAAAGGFRYSGLAKNGTFVQSGSSTLGDATLTAWMGSGFEVQMVAGDYIEVWLYQNRTAGTALNLDVSGETPQVSVRRVEL